jgi:shikimate kinase
VVGQENIRNIVLIGFMGTGKSTVGKKLAKSLSWTFIDTDTNIENREKKTIPDIFRDHGEAYFRNVESEVIEQVMKQTNQVVSMGGGAVLLEGNRKSMLDNGLVITLTATPEIIIQRLQGNSDRPLLQGDIKERVFTMMEQRQGAYDFAHVSIDTHNKSSEEIAAQIKKLL